MRQQSALPPEFKSIEHLVNFVQRKSTNEYSGSCPVCGGTEHKNGDWPDRFVMFRVGRYGFPLAFCRNCGYRWTAKGQQPSQEDVDAWRKNQIEVEEARKRAAERAIEILQNDHAWERFFEQNNDYSMNVFRQWGLSDSWIKYLKLGLIPDYVVHNKNEEEYHTPAFTLPMWFCGGVVQNIQVRMANPRTERDRYRNFYSMGTSCLFVPLYNLPLNGNGVIVEGAKKAAVVEQHLGNVNYRVVGVQSKTPDQRLIDQMKDLDPIYLCLDPDAFVLDGEVKDKNAETAVQRMTRLIGKERVRIVELPVKPDDGINCGMDMWKYIRMARKA